MKKKIIALFLTVSLFVSLLCGCGLMDIFREELGENEPDQLEPAEEMTRGEWIAALAEEFGLDGSQTETPYFSDVDAGDELFPYVQAAADWGILSVYSGSETLDADKPVTWEEMAATAAIAAGWNVDEDQFNADGTFDPSGAIGFAASEGILPSGSSLEDHASQQNGEATLAAASATYLAHPASSSSVVFTDAVLDLSDVPSNRLQISGFQLNAAGTVTTDAAGKPVAVIETGSGAVEVSEGSVIITAPTTLCPAGVAYKVVAFQEEGGQVSFSTTEPVLEDIYEELMVTETVSASADNIIWEDGISAVPNHMSGSGRSYHISLMSSRSAKRDAQPNGMSYNAGGYSKSFKFGDGNFSQSWTNQNSPAVTGGAAKALENSNFVYTDTPSIDDFGGSTEPWTKNLEIENKFSGGYEITGNITLNALTVTTHVDYKKGLFGIPYGVRNAYVQVDSDISSTLTMKGELKWEQKIATVPIPIGPTGLSVSIDLYLYATASGSLEVAAKLSTMAKVEYAEGSGIKCSKNANSTATVDAAIEVGAGVKLSASLDALGFIKIMDANVTAGAEATAEAHLKGICDVTEADGVTTLYYRQSLAMQADIYAPIVSISAGGSGTLLGKLGLSKTWNVMTRANCWHGELLDQEWVFWEAEVTMDTEGNILDEDERTIDEKTTGSDAPDTESQQPVGFGKLDIASYYCALPVGETYTIEVSALPEGRSVSDVVWSTDDAGVAMVSGGVVTAVSPGVTTVRANLDGTTVLCTVSVS